MTKDFTLYAGTVKLIKELLALGGWANEVIDVYNAGKLIETLPDAAQSPSEFLKEVTITLTDRQFSTIVKTLRHHATKGIIIPSPFATQAIEQFELIDA